VNIPLQEHAIVCPYCLETIEVLLDLSAGDQAYIEDCQVCCRPIEFALRVFGEDFQLEVRRDDE
jgi:hypothetical protein